MNHLVVYLDNLSPAQRRSLEPVFGRSRRANDVLPLVSPPLEDEQLVAMLAKLGELGLAFVQPPEPEIPAMTLATALGLVRAHSAWAELIQSFRVRSEDVEINAKEFPRCWLILAQAIPVGLPPGEGYVVDKYSHEVIPHRYIDVADALGAFDHQQPRLKVRCIDNRPFLIERGGILRFGAVDGQALIDLTVGRIYDAQVEDADYYRVWDNSGEDYLYPKSMFERVSPTRAGA